jgi:hypothetical protein
MRPPRCKKRSWIWRATIGALAAGSWAVPADAQSGVAEEAALFLLLPVGARSVAIGTATAAASGTTEAVWWNPAGIANLRRRNAALHHGQTIAGTTDAISLTVSSSLLGVVALSAGILDYGRQPVRDEFGNHIGDVFPRDVALVFTYGTEIGTRFRTGLSYKFVQTRFDCSGRCPDIPTTAASTSAIDAGVQADFGARSTFTIGAAVRNMGVRLQVEDSPQSDPLPTRLQVGASYRFIPPPPYDQEAELRFSADLIDEVRVGRPLPRIGAELMWQKRAFVRGGYIFEASDTESGGPSFGLGYATERIGVDLARIFTGLSADAGQAPTYLSLRVMF